MHRPPEAPVDSWQSTATVLFFANAEQLYTEQTASLCGPRKTELLPLASSPGQPVQPSRQPSPATSMDPPMEVVAPADPPDPGTDLSLWTSEQLLTLLGTPREREAILIYHDRLPRQPAELKARPYVPLQTAEAIDTHTGESSPPFKTPKAKRPRPTPLLNILPTFIPTPTNNSFLPLVNDTSDMTNTFNFPPPPPICNDPTAPTPTKALKSKKPAFTPLENFTFTHAKSSSLNNAPPPTTPTDTIPPTIIHDKNSWITISTQLKALKISYSKATNTSGGIRVTASTVPDFRTLHNFLTTHNHSFHSYQLPSERTIKVVLRGVPQNLTDEQILTDLTSQSYIPLSVSRINGRDKKPSPLVTVQLERKFSSIFQLKTVLGIDITVEAKRIPTAPLQCHRCQKFGHTQPNCHAPYRCMKCAEFHSTHLCPKPRTTPATCANCTSEHISTHHSCPNNPLNRAKSYAQATKPSSTPFQPSTTNNPTSHTPNPATDSFATLCFPLFQALLATNPTPERITAFTTQILILKQILNP